MKLVKKVSFFFLFFFISCSGNKADKKTIARAYVDIMVSREEFSDKLDTLSFVRSEILQRYNLDSTDYEKAIQKMKTDEKLWEDFYKEVYVYLDSLKEDVGIN